MYKLRQGDGDGAVHNTLDGFIGQSLGLGGEGISVVEFDHLSAIFKVCGKGFPAEGSAGAYSMQFDTPGRGFSFLHDAPLDMRFGPHGLHTAADIVNTYAESELEDLLYEYGEERDSRKIARAIVKARPLHTTRELVAVIEAVSPRRGDRVHPATRTFQALRIAVNDELSSIKELLPQAVASLKPGGRLAVISFHSPEDRIVKNFFRDQSKDLFNPPYERMYEVERKAIIKEVNRKPIGSGRPDRWPSCPRCRPRCQRPA